MPQIADATGLGKDLIDWFFPPLCASCDLPLNPGDDDFLCPECRPFLEPVSPPDCIRCSVLKNTPQQVCPLCARLPNVFASITSAYEYHGTAGRLVRSLKFRGGEYLASNVARLLVGAQSTRIQQLRDDLGVHTIIPAPMHPWRRLRKGFNQAESLALELGQLLKMQVIPDTVHRVRRAPPQARTASVEERMANVQHVFAPAPGRPLAGTPVLLVDDVLTTGATSTACATALLAAGAIAVHILTFARAGHGHDHDPKNP